MKKAQNSAAESKPWQFKKGQSGNPGGRPKAVRELLERARKSVPAAFDLAERLLEDEEAEPRVRLDAAKFLTSYGIGAPPKEIDEDDEVQTSARVAPEKALAVLLRLKKNDEPAPDPSDD